MPRAAPVNDKFNADYICTLSQEDLERYQKKVDLCNGLDPYELETKSLSQDLDLLPKITEVDRILYLVCTTNPVTRDQMKCLKSLDAHTFVTDGFCQRPLCRQLDQTLTVVCCIVNHSQKQLPPVKCWILARNIGDILVGHCTCMAGKGEVCSHVGAAIFAVELLVNARDNRVCTELVNKWLPPHLKKIPFQRIRDTEFTSADTKYDQAVKALSGDDNNNEAVSVRYCGMQKPSASAFEAFIRQVGVINPKASVLSCIDEYCGTFTPEDLDSQLPSPLTDLFDNCYMSLLWDDLLAECKIVFVNLQVSHQEIMLVEEKTRKQANSDVWFSQRAGRITGSKMGRALATDPNNPSLSLIKAICYPQACQFYSKACEYGKQMEPAGCKYYVNLAGKSHEGLKVDQCGFLIMEGHPFIGASPDGIIYCDCHPGKKGALEVKCPQKENFCKSLKNGMLDKTHDHYYQIQTEIMVTGAAYGVYVVYSKTLKPHIETIQPDPVVQLQIIDKSKVLFQQAILPELLAKYFSELRNTVLDPNISRLSQVCSCKLLPRDPMVKCSGASCIISIFHCKCVGLKVPPRTKKWFCSQCKLSPPLRPNRTPRTTRKK